jgi:putative transposase
VKVLLAYRYELDPNNVQRTLFAKSAGCARKAYNWALNDRIKRFQKNEGKAKFTSAIEQHRELNKLKATEFPWMYEVSKCAPQEALRDCERAFKNFWRGRKTGQAVGFPQFHKKGRHDSFRLTGAVQVTAGGVKLPRIGEVRTKESTAKFRGRVLSATVSREADRWFCSLAVEQVREQPKPVTGEPTALDLGIDTFAMTSEGERLESPQPLKKLLRLLKRRSRQHSRKQKKSANRRKSAQRLAKIHRRIRNVRQDFLHKTSTCVAKNHSIVCIEDLAVKNLLKKATPKPDPERPGHFLKNGRAQKRGLSRAIADAGWSEFRRMLDYKCRWYGSELRVIDRFAPSSKTCSECGARNESLALSDRTFVCKACGCVIPRDENAARNILKLGLEMKTQSTESSSESQVGRQRLTQKACGDRISERRSAKQEVSTPELLHQVAV